MKIRGIKRPSTTQKGSAPYSPIFMRGFGASLLPVSYALASIVVMNFEMRHLDVAYLHETYAFQQDGAFRALRPTEEGLFRKRNRVGSWEAPLFSKQRSIKK